MGRAPGAREVNVGWTNRSECNEQWEAKRGSGSEARGREVLGTMTHHEDLAEADRLIADCMDEK
jgi:hypothetical protein